VEEPDVEEEEEEEEEADEEVTAAVDVEDKTGTEGLPLGYRGQKVRT
jgi:hypothetical protein